MPLSSPFTCGPHAYTVAGTFDVHVSAQSVCPQGTYCICNTLDCSWPCANLAGGQYCDDVAVSAAAGVGGVSELGEVVRAKGSGWRWAAMALGAGALLVASAALRKAR
jgi:hypothetical protein